jgi:hypothetical protein
VYLGATARSLYLGATAYYLYLGATAYYLYLGATAYYVFLKVGFLTYYIYSEVMFCAITTLWHFFFIKEHVSIEPILCLKLVFKINY